MDLLLRTSDNYLTEAIGRMAALAAGKPGSNDGAVAAVLQQLEELKIPAATLRAADVSGLALANQVSARQLSEVVRAITSGADTRLRAGLAGFPVAGLTGTLGDRYVDARHGPRRGTGPRQDRHAEHGDRPERLRGGRRRPAPGVFLHRQRPDPRGGEQDRAGPHRLRPCRLRLPLTGCGRRRTVDCSVNALLDPQNGSYGAADGLDDGDRARRRSPPDEFKAHCQAPVI